jgi:hypothetical protein
MNSPLTMGAPSFVVLLTCVQFKDKIMRALIEQAPKVSNARSVERLRRAVFVVVLIEVGLTLLQVARHKLSDLFSRKKPAATFPTSANHGDSFGGSASAPVTPIVGTRGDVLMSRSAGGGGVKR